MESKSEITPVKNRYKSTISDILVPIRNPIGHLPGVQFGAVLYESVQLGDNRYSGKCNTNNTPRGTD